MALDYRTVIKQVENHQEVAVVDQTESTVPNTRAIEHKYFNPFKAPVAFDSKEFPRDWTQGHDPYYPVMDKKFKNLKSTSKTSPNQQKHYFRRKSRLV